MHKTTCFFPLFHNYHKTFFTIITTTTTSESSVFPSELVPSPPIPIPLPLSFLYVLACWLECFQKSALARSFQTAHTQDRHCSSVSLWHPQQEERIASNLENKILSAKSATFVAIPTLYDSHFLRFFGLSVMDFKGFREIGCLIFASKSTNRPISIQILESDDSRFGYKSVQMFSQ